MKKILLASAALAMTAGLALADGHGKTIRMGTEGAYPLKDAVPYEQRLEVIRSLWQVVLADGTRADEEDALLRLVSNLLGISDTDSAIARQNVKN